MERGRKYRKAGEIITLGGVDYLLEGVEGCGGSAVVYRASYEDRLNQGCVHRVLIKELFPYHPKGLIYRDESGGVCCNPEGRAFMESCRKSFYQGNQANLRLLEMLPEQISGNLNSYEAYGTFYSILSVHGGQILEQALEEGQVFRTLKEAARGMICILDALECFHRQGLLHLDISPDNVVMLPERALLIDYNSVWALERGADEAFFFSEKQGYTAPEVRLREIGSISFATDLYSVCAVFFRMLTGRILSDSDLMGKGLQRCFPRDMEIFRGEPVSAAWKSVQIVTRGLHVLARKRYQSTSQLREEFEELIRRIDGSGVSESALWESSRKAWRQRRAMDGQYLMRQVCLEGGRVIDGDICFSMLRDGGQLLLNGPGGMGKTQFMTELWGRGMESYRPSAPVVWYIPLMDYQDAGEEPYYIRKYLLGRLCFQNGQGGMAEAMHELNRLLGQTTEQGSGWILLLDGLNEAGSRREKLLREIEDLGRKPGIGVLVTDRSETVKEYGLTEFQPAKLLPLRTEEVCRELDSCNISRPDQEELLELLCNPMMLSLYKKTVNMQQENGRELSGENPAGTMEEMVGRYLESLCISQMRMDSGSQTEQLRHSYVLRHLLPEVAGEMKRRKKTLLTFQELYGLVKKNYHSLQKKTFAMAFPEYLGKSRLMLKGISNEDEWFDYAVAEQLMDRLNLLEKSEQGSFGLIHDNFMDYLEGEAVKNRQIRAQYQRKSWRMWICAGVAAGVLALGAGTVVWRTRVPVQMSEEERMVIRNAANRLMMNLQILDLQLYTQETILEQASSDEVLDGVPSGLERFSSFVERKRGEMARYMTASGDGEKWLEQLELMGTDIPLEYVQSLYAKPEEMEGIMEEALSYLEEMLCSEESPYFERSRREPLVNSYRAYIEAYGQVCYLELNQVLAKMEPETAGMVLDAAAEMAVMKTYILSYPLSGMTEEEMDRQLESAKKQLKEARGEMKMQNYRMDAAGW